jgi:hypothetical protein
MKLKLKFPNGAELEFEGEQSEFERVAEFVVDPPDALVLPMERPQQSGGKTGDDGGGGDDDDGGGGGGPRGTLDPAYVAERLSMVGASTDIDRLTVIAQLAVEAGMAGADYETAERLYNELGFRKPSRFTKAVANAKSRKLVRTVGQGIWKPTYMGENYARGLGRSTREPAHRRAAQRPQLSVHAGGDDDA